MLPSLSVIYRPTRVWQSVREARPSWTVSLFVQVLPLALLCAVPWRSPQTVFLCVASVAVLALGFFALAPWFQARCSWNGAMAVAAYGSTPVLVSWFLLVFPAFAIVPVIALLHCFAVSYLGVQQVLDCRESEAALLVAAAWIFSAFASMVLGGLCAAAGLI